MGTRVVELKGTWSRTNTDPWDVAQYRRYAVRRVADNHGTLLIRVPRKQPDDGSMEGTFKATIPVVVGWYGLDSRQVTRAAKKLFEAMLALTMCRAPRIKYTATSITTDRDLQEGLLR